MGNKRRSGSSNLHCCCRCVYGIFRQWNRCINLGLGWGMSRVVFQLTFVKVESSEAWPTFGRNKIYFMKLRSIFCALLFSTNLLAQNFEVFTGVGVNNFFDKGQDDWNSSSVYQGKLANCLGFGLFGKTSLGHEMGLTLKFMAINGGIDISSQAHGAGYHQQMDAKIKTIELGFYPLTFSSLNEKFEIRIGLEFAYLLSGQLKGQYKSWYLDLDNSTYPPTTIYVNKSKPINSNLQENFTILSAFACVKMGYNFRFGPNLNLIPRLHIGYGLGKRLTEKIGARPKNWVSIFELAAQRHF